jgi:hypothetical protein
VCKNAGPTNGILSLGKNNLGYHLLTLFDRQTAFIGDPKAGSGMASPGDRSSKSELVPSIVAGGEGKASQATIFIGSSPRQAAFAVPRRMRNGAPADGRNDVA